MFMKRICFFQAMERCNQPIPCGAFNNDGSMFAYSVCLIFNSNKISVFLFYFMMNNSVLFMLAIIMLSCNGLSIRIKKNLFNHFVFELLSLMKCYCHLLIPRLMIVRKTPSHTLEKAGQTSLANNVTSKEHL